MRTADFRALIHSDIGRPASQLRQQVRQKCRRPGGGHFWRENNNKTSSDGIGSHCGRRRRRAAYTDLAVIDELQESGIESYLARCLSGSIDLM